MSDMKQIRFDGGEIDAELCDLRREICEVFGVGYEQAERMLTAEEYVGEWARLLEIEGIGAVDPHALTYPEHYTGILWTAEVAGQPGPRAVDLALIHDQTDGEVELFFYKDAYAVRAFDQFALMENWDRKAWILTEAGNPGDELLNVFVEDENGNVREAFMDDFAHAYDPESYAWVEGCCEFEVLDPENHPVQVMHRDMMYEHTDPVTIASHEGVFKFASRGGVMWERYGGDGDAPAWAWDMARARYNDDAPEGYVRVASGWHDSMSSSEQSDVINGITSGDYHDNFPEADPVMVAFWGTGNVCSVGVTLYTTPDQAEVIESLFDGKGAVPGYAGVRP